MYDRLKWITQIFLPAFGTLYFSLSGIWGFPAGQQVVGTVTAIVFFFGILLNISSAQYKNSDARFSGVVVVNADEEKATMQLDSEALHGKDEITLKVQKPRKRR